jgi:hypothetical protein
MNTKKNNSIQENYINTLYNADKKSFTSYPFVFINYLTDTKLIKEKNSLVFVRRREFLNGFKGNYAFI